MENRRRSPIIIVVIILIVGAIGYFAYETWSQNKAASQLTASGTIEATNVNVAPEEAGKVRDVLVEEGQSVQAGEALMHLDDALLQAQKEQAVAALDVAKAAAATSDAGLASAQNQYDLALNASLATDDSLAAEWLTNRPSDFNLPLWYYSQTEQMSSAQAEVTAAQQALNAAQTNLASVEASAGGSGFLKIEGELADAEAGYNVANDLNNRIQNGVNVDQLTRFGLYQLAKQQNAPPTKSDYLINANNIDQNIKDYSKQLFDDAKSNLRDAQNAYNDALTSQGAKDVLKARAAVSLEQERYNTAMDYVSAIQTGRLSPAVSTAQSALGQAKAADDQANTAVQQAQANLDLIDTQLAKLTIYAPLDGIILTRNVEPGEFVQPGANALTMADIAHLTITVYVPEDLYGRISLGMQATMKVDSFPGQTFNAQVSYISDQAEFTPRNVQTVEG
ncbi:MAG TPA: efflux RND transporter periplasmic adaptor subunit, partial [Anaerolineales bacterium]|nr:efflux RND transporter periplasmic adaptor subunit [Anaerolineales bacterium]